MTNVYKHKIALPHHVWGIHKLAARGVAANCLGVGAGYFRCLAHFLTSCLARCLARRLAHRPARYLTSYPARYLNWRKLAWLAFVLLVFCLVLPLNSFAKSSSGSSGKPSGESSGGQHSGSYSGPYSAENDEFGDLDANPNAKPLKAAKHVLSFASLGQNHSLVLDGDSTLWVFGDNNFGQLGLAGQAAVVGPLALLKNVKNVTAGPNHSFAITQDGTLWAFGENTYGQLGTGSLKGNSNSLGGTPSDGAVANNLSPVLSRILAVSTSAKHTLAVDETGTVWAFGNNSQGQLGTGNMLSSPSPLKVMSGASAVLAGNEFSLALAREYTLWAWGNNAFGQLGTGSTKNATHPYPVLSQVMKVSAGNFHVLALRGDDSLWAWGGNKFGQVGDGSTEMRLAPVKIMDKVAELAAGPDYSLALGLDGRLWAWGRIAFTAPANVILGSGSAPTYGQASGQGSVQASGPTSGSTSGDASGEALAQEGGQMPSQGLSQKSITRPKLILEDIAQIAVADQCCLALGKDGKLWFFGRLNAPEYGDEHLPGASFSPFRLNSPLVLAENVELAVPGVQHLLFIKQDGSLWGMGNNFSGQTGNKNLELILEPQKVKFKIK